MDECHWHKPALFRRLWLIASTMHIWLMHWIRQCIAFLKPLQYSMICNLSCEELTSYPPAIARRSKAKSAVLGRSSGLRAVACWMRAKIFAFAWGGIVKLYRPLTCACKLRPNPNRRYFLRVPPKTWERTYQHRLSQNVIKFTHSVHGHTELKYVCCLGSRRIVFRKGLGCYECRIWAQWDGVRVE